MIIIFLRLQDHCIVKNERELYNDEFEGSESGGNVGGKGVAGHRVLAVHFAA